MTRLSHSEMLAKAGFKAGEIEKSRNLRASFCSGTATADQLAEYSQYAHKWDEFSRLTAERDQADAIEQRAPDPARHTGDDALGAALRQHRDNQPPPRTVVRTRLIAVDDGTGSLMNLPQAEPLPQYRGSADASGHKIIAAGLSANAKR